MTMGNIAIMCQYIYADEAKSVAMTPEVAGACMPRIYIPSSWCVRLAALPSNRYMADTLTYPS